MKRIVATIGVIMMIAIISGCTAGVNDSANSTNEQIRPVKALTLQVEEKNIILQYTGNIGIKDSRTYAFKNGGKVLKVFYEKGQQVSKGDVLATLDTSDLQFAVDASKGKVAAAEAQYNKAANGATAEDIRQLSLNVEKARNAYTYTEDLYTRMESLFQAGGISENDLNKLRLEKDISYSELQQAQTSLQNAENGTRAEDIALARANLSMAQTDLSYQESLIQDATLIADMDGYVAEVIQKEGSFVQGGYPVVALRGQAQVVITGIARQDMDKIFVGTKVNILDDDQVISGTVTKISDIADEYTRTYEAEITPDQDTLSLGSIVALEMIIGNEEGIWIPISSMMFDGKDYVYIMVPDENNEDTILAKRKEITIESTKGAYAKVSGLESGQQLIIEGMRSIQENEPVQVIGE